MIAQNYKSTLVSLAMLKARIDGGGSYLDNIIPFVSYVIREKRFEEKIEAEVVQNDIKSEFGIFIPINSILFIFKRLTKQGILKKDYQQFFIERATEEFDNFKSNRSNTERNIVAVINEFVRFSKDRYDKTLTEKKASEITLGFLSEFSIECLAAFEENIPFPMDLEIKQDEQILIASFIKDIQENSPERFNGFVQIVKGHMLANALLCPTLTSDKFGGVTFYMDTPLIIKFLGMNGDVEKTVVTEMIEILVNLKGKIAIFDHTKNEISNFIEWLANHGHKQNIRNPAAVEMRKNGRGKTEMLLLKNQYVDDLREKGIRMINSPPFNQENFKYQIDEGELEKCLKDEIRYFNNPDAVKYDIQSVRSVQVLRKGRNSNHIERSVAVLVTSNKSFAKAVRQHESNPHLSVSYHVPSVIWDSELTNLAWLKFPLRISQKVPEHRVISNVYAMLNPGEAYWSKVTEAVEKLQQEGVVNEQSLALLRADPSLLQEINERSLGSTDIQSISNATKEILNKITLKQQIRIKQLKSDIQSHKDKQADNNIAVADKLSWILTSSLAFILCIILLSMFGFTVIGIAGSVLSIAAFLGFSMSGIRKKVSNIISEFIKKNILDVT